MTRLSRSKSGRAVVALALVAGGSGLAAIIWWGLTGSWEPHLTLAFIAFAVFVALGDLLDVPLERRAAFSMSLAPALGFAMLRVCTDSSCSSRVSPQVGQVAAVFLLGTAAATVVRLVRKQDPRLTVIETRLLVVVSASVVYAALLRAFGDVWAFGLARMSVSGLLAVLLVVVGLDSLLEALVAASRERTRFRNVFRDHVRVTIPLLISTGSIAALLALAYPTLGIWTLPLFLIPMAATQYSFHQVAQVRTNHLQTVAALAKVPEMAGYTQRGHSKRVAQLSIAMAVELGVPQHELQEIEYAALLHDIGRISLEDPEDSVKRTADLQLALVGAEIIEETGHFPKVAAMVRDQHEPYRRAGEDVNGSVPLGSKIIRAASAYDDLVNPSGPGHPARDAIDKLYLGMAFDFDPAVIQALTRVLEREGSL